MGSNASGPASANWQPPPAPAIASFIAPTPAPDVTPVWVVLPRHFRHDPTQDRSVPDGLDLTGRARGFLRRPWHRCAHCGTWVGSVTFKLRYADGREHTLIVRDQLVHTDALQPRDDGRHL